MGKKHRKTFGALPPPQYFASKNEYFSTAISTRTELTATLNETEQERKTRLNRFTITFNNMPAFKLIARTKGKFTEEMLTEIIKKAE